MPIPKRYLFDSHLYGPPDLYEESPPQNLLENIAMSQTLGTLHQLRYLAMYSVEIFDNLIRLSTDLSDRIQMVNIRTNLLVTKIPLVEKKVRSTDLIHAPKKKKVKKFRSREPYIPSTLTKNTNSSQIKSQYSFCNIIPQLWKMETVLPDDCVIQYSHPGFFFEEWLKVEVAKQDELRKEKKKAKEERKKIREEKRKKRREEDEKQASSMSARDRAKARARQLKEEKRKEKERAAQEAEENKRRIAASRPTLSSFDPSISSQPLPAPPHTATSPPSHPSKPTTMPPTPQEVKSRYPPNSIAAMPTTNPPTPHRLSPRYPEPSQDEPFPPPKSGPSSEKKSRKSDPSLKELPSERKSNEHLPRSRAPSATGSEKFFPPPPDDLDLPPDDDDFPPDDEPPPPDDDFPIPEEDEFPLPDDDELPPLDDDLPNPDFDEPPPPSPGDDPELPPAESPPPPLIRETSASLTSSPRQPSRPPSPIQSKPLPEPPAAAVVVPQVPLPPKPAPKSRRKSILDIKADRKAVVAAASENLRSLNQRVDLEGDRDRESEEFGDQDLVRDSIQSFSKPFSKHEPILETEEESGRDSPPAIEYTLPRRASIRLPSYGPPPEGGVNQRRSSVARRQSLSQTTPLSATELKRGTRNSTLQPFAEHEADEEHALYAAASARAARETVEAMSSLYQDQNNNYNDNNYNNYNAQDEGYYHEPPAPDGEYHEQYQAQEGGGGEYYDGNEYGEGGYYQYDDQYYQGDQSYWNPDAPEVALDELPPMEEQPVQVRQQSSLAIFGGGDILENIRSGKVLRRAAPPPPKERSARETSLDLIKSGGVQLKRAEPIVKKATEQRSGAIAAILSNRAQIAGSGSDSDSSESDFSDDDLF